MESTHDILRNEIETKVALALIESLTAEKVLSLVKTELTRTEGYYSKPFLEQIISRILKDSIETCVRQKMKENEPVIHEAVSKAIGNNFMDKLVDNITLDFFDGFELTVKKIVKDSND